MTLFWRYINFLSTWRNHREAVKQLNRLTDQELKDIGINRSDIDRMVWLEEDKQQRGKNNND